MNKECTPRTQKAKLVSKPRSGCNRGLYGFRLRLMAYLFALVLASLLGNFLLCVFGKADANVLSERLGAIFYAGCGALITLFLRIKVDGKLQSKRARHGQKMAKGIVRAQGVTPSGL